MVRLSGSLGIGRSRRAHHRQRSHRGAVEKSRGSVLRAHCRQTGYLHRGGTGAFQKSLSGTVSGPPRKSDAARANLHIYLHIFTDARNNLLYLLLFERTCNALKIRRPQGRGGSSPPLGTIKSKSCGRSSFGKWQIFCDIRGLESADPNEILSVGRLASDLSSPFTASMSALA